MGTHGKVASPLWPRNYPHNSNYQWIVNVNESQVIHGRILEMDVEGTFNCYYDKLRVSFQGQSMFLHFWQIAIGYSRSKVMSIQASANHLGESNLRHDYPV